MVAGITSCLMLEGCVIASVFGARTVATRKMDFMMGRIGDAMSVLWRSYNALLGICDCGKWQKQCKIKS